MLGTLFIPSTVANATTVQGLAAVAAADTSIAQIRAEHWMPVTSEDSICQSVQIAQTSGQIASVQGSITQITQITQIAQIAQIVQI